MNRKHTDEHVGGFAGFFGRDVVDSSLAIVVLPPDVVDLRCWLAQTGFGKVPRFSTSKAGALPHIVCSVLGVEVRPLWNGRLVVDAAALVPGWFGISWSRRWNGLHHSRLLGVWLVMGLLGLILALAIFIAPLEFGDRLVFAFCYECLVDQCLEVREVQHAELTTESRTETTKEAVYLSLFSGHIMHRVPCRMVEHVQILSYSHVALDKSEKFPLLGFQHPSGNMVGAELLLESLPSDIFSCRPYCFGIFPPNCGIALKVMGGEWNLIHFITVSDL